MVSAVRRGGSSAVPSCRGEAPPAHGAAPLQPNWHLRGGSGSSQLSARPPVCARLSPGICTGAPVGCPNASHSSRVLRGAPAAPRAAGGPFPAPRGPGRRPCRAAGPTPARTAGIRFLSHRPAPAPPGPGSSRAGWATSPLALPKEQGAVDLLLPYSTRGHSDGRLGGASGASYIPGAGAWQLLARVQLWEVRQAGPLLVPVVILGTVTAAAIQCNCDTNCCALWGKRNNPWLSSSSQERW